MNQHQKYVNPTAPPESSIKATPSGFAGPKGVSVDKSGNLYVTDEDNNRLLRFDRAE